MTNQSLEMSLNTYSNVIYKFLEVKYINMCSMSWKEFLKSATDFLELSKAYQDTWSLVEKDPNEGNTYLVKKQKVSVPLDEVLVDDDPHPVDLETNEDPSIRIESREEFFEIEYHVAYSISYQVPVLYFRGFREDGKPIGLEDAWKLFQNPSGDSKSRTKMLSTLTQTDHPVLFLPFLGLHPCRTAELLHQMGSSRNLILTFLSVMGPFVKLNLKNEYGLSLQK